MTLFPHRFFSLLSFGIPPSESSTLQKARSTFSSSPPLGLTMGLCLLLDLIVVDTSMLVDSCLVFHLFPQFSQDTFITTDVLFGRSFQPVRIWLHPLRVHPSPIPVRSVSCAFHYQAHEEHHSYLLTLSVANTFRTHRHESRRTAQSV